MCSKLAEAIHETDRWDLVLFLEPDVEFIQDGTAMKRYGRTGRDAAFGLKNC